MSFRFRFLLGWEYRCFPLSVICGSAPRSSRIAPPLGGGRSVCGSALVTGAIQSHSIPIPNMSLAVGERPYLLPYICPALQAGPIYTHSYNCTRSACWRAAHIFPKRSRLWGGPAFVSLAICRSAPLERAHIFFPIHVPPCRRGPYIPIPITVPALPVGERGPHIFPMRSRLQGRARFRFPSPYMSAALRRFCFGSALRSSRIPACR